MHENILRLFRRCQFSHALVVSLLVPCVVLVASMLAPMRALAQDEPVFGRHWGVYATVDSSTWEGLGDVVPVGRGGSFETGGVGISFGGYMSVGRLGSAWVLAGGELGYLGFNSNVIFEVDPFSVEPESAFEVNHIMGSAVFRFFGSSSRYLDLGVGLGQYISDTKYIDCSVILRCFAAETGDTSVGLALSIAGSPGLGLIFGARVHFVDFDPIEAVDLGVRGLEGPIYSLYVGWEFGSYRDVSR